MLVVKKKTPKKKIFLMVGLALLAATVLSLAGYGIHRQFFAKEGPSKPTQTGATINYNPPTEEELGETNEHKENLANPSSPPPTTSSGKRRVQPALSSIDKTAAYTYVTGVFEEGGTCTLTLSQGSKTITKTATGFGSASYTQCTPIDVSSEQLEGGSWNVVLTYTSNTSEGRTEIKDIKL